MPLYKISDSINGYITLSDLLKVKGTINAIVGRGGDFLNLFSLESDDFTFILSINRHHLFIKRNESQIKLPITDLDESIIIFLVWSENSIGLEAYDLNSSGKNSSYLETKFTIPPPELVRWARSANLIETKFYQSYEEFRERIHTTFSSLQEKINSTRSYISCWDIGENIRPKDEVNVHPYFHSLFYDPFFLASIEVIPEYTSVVGKLDFLLIGQGTNGPFYFCVEFKNAHSKDILSGYTKQLPAYMTSKGAKYGAYCILNYKGQWFNQPESSNISVDVVATPTLVSKNIRVFEFDLSKPISASKIKVKGTSSENNE